MPWAAGTKKDKKVLFFPYTYRVVAVLCVSERLDQLDEIKVKCRDLPVGKASLFLSQTWTKGEVLWEQRGHPKRVLIYAMNAKKAKQDPILHLCMEKTSPGTIKSVGLRTKTLTCLRSLLVSP